MARELTLKHRGPSNRDIVAGKKAATVADVESTSDDTSNDDGPGPERHGVDEAGSDVEPSSSEAEESDEPALDKKIGSRKPSKKVLETAMNEVSAISGQ